jgi:hypothetical protein
MRGRQFEPGNTSGPGRPRGSPNKKSLVLQELLVDQGGEIIKTLINRAKKGDRTALALCMERLIPRLKDVPELPVEQSQEDPQLADDVDPSRLTDEELDELERLSIKIRVAKSESGDGGAPAPKAA